MQFLKRKLKSLHILDRETWSFFYLQNQLVVYEQYAGKPPRIRGDILAAYFTALDLLCVTICDCIGCRDDVEVVDYGDECGGTEVYHYCSRCNCDYDNGGVWY